MPTVKIYTDGSCRGNPGPGGWAAILLYKGKTKEHRKEISGHEKHTTNNKMELTAVVEGLNALKRACIVEVFTDSKYIRDGIKWMERWKVNGWKTSSGRPVKNKSLWLQIIRAMKEHQIQFNWSPGHSGIPENERADRLAKRESGRYINEGY